MMFAHSLPAFHTSLRILCAGKSVITFPKTTVTTTTTKTITKGGG